MGSSMHRSKSVLESTLPALVVVTSLLADRLFCSLVGYPAFAGSYPLRGEEFGDFAKFFFIAGIPMALMDSATSLYCYAGASLRWCCILCW